MAATVLVAVLSSPFGEYLWLLAALAPLVLAAVSIACVLFAIGNWQSRRRSSLLAGALGFAVCFGFLRLNPHFTSGVRFALQRASYEEKVRIILQAKAEGRDVEKLNISDFAYLDDGPPVRVSFFWFRGVTDNWVGLVFDPTDEVMKANQFKRDWSNWNDPNLQGIKRLFDGDLYYAEHLSGHWYLCGFT